MLNLGKGISEYEEASVRQLWEEPAVYHDVVDADYFLVSGRKGSGKSTMVEYRDLTADPNKESVISIRPGEDGGLFERVQEIASAAGEPHLTLRNSLAKLFEFVFYVVAMHAVVKENEDKISDPDLKRVYSFLAQNNLFSGSVIRSALDLLAELTEDFTHLKQLFTLLGKIKAPRFQVARESLFRFMKRNDYAVTIFVDDIDGYGFDYTKENRAFLEALVIRTMRSDTYCVKNGVPFRLIVTPPSELLENARFWNMDKISLKTVYLRWENLEKLKALVSKRISAAAPTSPRKRKQRYEGDVLSIDPAKTWERFFPASVTNRIESREPTLQYIARHTFYTPRNVLTICQKILQMLEDRKLPLGDVSGVSEADWTSVIQEVCEECSIEAARNAMDIYEILYDGIEEFLSLFEDRPNIWTGEAFRGFVDSYSRGQVKDIGGEEFLGDDRILAIMHSMGFVGFAFQSATSPPGTRMYDLFFSYVRPTKRTKWDLAVISPVFYDHLRIKPVTRVEVVPNQRLVVRTAILEQVKSYDFERNRHSVG